MFRLKTRGGPFPDQALRNRGSRKLTTAATPLLSPLNLGQAFPRQVAAEELHVAAHEEGHQSRAHPPDHVEVPNVQVLVLLGQRCGRRACAAGSTRMPGAISQECGKDKQTQEDGGWDGFSLGEEFLALMFCSSR